MLLKDYILLGCFVSPTSASFEKVPNQNDEQHIFQVSARLPDLCETDFSDGGR